MTAFDFEISNAQTGQSDVITNADGARGIQILGVVTSLGDDDNRASVAIVAISDGEEASQEYLRFEGLPPGDTSLAILYPGIEAFAVVSSFARSGVLPAKFQVQVSNVMGNDMSAHFYCSLLP